MAPASPSRRRRSSRASSRRRRRRGSSWPPRAGRAWPPRANSRRPAISAPTTPSSSSTPAPASSTSRTGLPSGGGMPERLFAIDPYLLDFEASVQARREHEGRPAVVLDRTAFYAESGGQPWDTGTLGEAPVVAVLVDGDDILHVLDRRLDEARVQGHVDGERRRDHRQQHHGQHLLSRAFVDVAAAATTSFHLGAELITIDLDRLVTDAQTRAAEARAHAGA